MVPKIETGGCSNKISKIEHIAKYMCEYETYWALIIKRSCSDTTAINLCKFYSI